MTAPGVLRPAPTTVPAIGTDLQAARTFERTGTALARSVAASASVERPAAPELTLVTDEDLGAELRGSLVLIASVLLPALAAVTLLH